MRPAAGAGLKASPERRPRKRGAESKSLGSARDREHVERPGGQIIHLYVNNPGWEGVSVCGVSTIMPEPWRRYGQSSQGDNGVRGQSCG